MRERYFNQLKRSPGLREARRGVISGSPRAEVWRDGRNAVVAGWLLGGGVKEVER